MVILNNSDNTKVNKEKTTLKTPSLLEKSMLIF